MQNEQTRVAAAGTASKTRADSTAEQDRLREFDYLTRSNMEKADVRTERLATTTQSFARAKQLATEIAAHRKLAQTAGASASQSQNQSTANEVRDYKDALANEEKIRQDAWEGATWTYERTKADLDRQLAKNEIDVNTFNSLKADALLTKRTTEGTAEETRTNQSIGAYVNFVDGNAITKVAWGTTTRNSAHSYSNSMRSSRTGFTGDLSVLRKTSNGVISDIEATTIRDHLTRDHQHEAATEGIDATWRLAITQAFADEREANAASLGQFEINSFTKHRDDMVAATATSGAHLQQYRIDVANADITLVTELEVSRNAFHADLTVAELAFTTSENTVRGSYLTSVHAAYVTEANGAKPLNDTYIKQRRDAFTDFETSTADASHDKTNLSQLDRDYQISEATEFETDILPLVTSDGSPWAILAAAQATASKALITSAATAETVRETAVAGADRDYSKTTATAEKDRDVAQAQAVEAHDVATAMGERDQIAAMNAAIAAAAAELGAQYAIRMRDTGSTHPSSDQPLEEGNEIEPGNSRVKPAPDPRAFGMPEGPEGWDEWSESPAYEAFMAAVNNQEEPEYDWETLHVYHQFKKELGKGALSFVNFGGAIDAVIRKLMENDTSRALLMEFFKIGTQLARFANVESSDILPFTKGLVVGFVYDGLGGLFGAIGGVGKLALKATTFVARNTPLGKTVRYMSGDDPFSDERWFAEQFGQAVARAQQVADWVSQVPSKLQQRASDNGRTVQGEIGKMAYDLFHKLLEVAGNLSAEGKGRIVGSILFEIVGAIVTLGFDKAAKAGKISALMDRFRGIVSKWDKSGDMLKLFDKGGEYYERARKLKRKFDNQVDELTEGVKDRFRFKKQKQRFNKDGFNHKNKKGDAAPSAEHTSCGVKRGECTVPGECFVAGTDVWMDFDAADYVATAKVEELEREEQADWNENWIAAAIIVGVVGIGGDWYLRRRKKRAEEQAIDEVFALGY